jgi:hypothetical protein
VNINREFMGAGAAVPVWPHRMLDYGPAIVKSAAMKQRKQPERAAGSGKVAKSGAKPDAAFDLWLKRGLHQIFDEIAAEPIPESLLKLIEADRKK